jgi:hypothetical protein
MNGSKAVVSMWKGKKKGAGHCFAHPGRSFIAVSFHRLFLGRLLPSRACFRFAGSLGL